MKVLVKTLGFSLALMLSFTAVTYVLPQMKGEAPDDEEVDVAALTMDSFINLGEDLYLGKGTCTLCHNNLGRAPDFLSLNVVNTSLERIRDPLYQGNAVDAAGYLRESMLDPSIYVVKGYGKKGTDDSESPMLAVDKPPVQLSDVEIDAIIAFLQAKDGNPVTVALPAETPVLSPTQDDTAGPARTVLAQNAEEAIAKYACAACHSILGTEAAIGPSLIDVGKRLTVDQIRESIIAPNAVVTDGYAPVMPDFSEIMVLKELELLVGFLAEQTGDQS
jgi:mono/diheme cytochrome c family protein